MDINSLIVAKVTCSSSSELGSGVTYDLHRDPASGEDVLLDE